MTRAEHDALYPALSEDLAKRFTYHAPKDGQQAFYGMVRASALEIAEYVSHELAPSREVSLAITKLEEFVMWANAACARNGLVEP